MTKSQCDASRNRKPEGQGFSPANNRRAEGATTLPKARLSSFAIALAVAFAVALAVALAVVCRCLHPSSASTQL